MWKKQAGRGKKAAPNCHLNIASCPCGSSSGLVVILGLLGLQRFPLFYFWEQNMDLDLHNPSWLLICDLWSVEVRLSSSRFSFFSTPLNDFWYYRWRFMGGVTEFSNWFVVSSFSHSFLQWGASPGSSQIMSSDFYDEWEKPGWRNRWPPMD